MNLDRPAQARRSQGWILFPAAALAALFFFYTAIEPSAECFSRQPRDYYGFQTAGFHAGHLYAAISPHPGLLALKDPYDTSVNGPYRINDISLYGGHYYLYFGASPILIAFWPCVALTGLYPSQALVVAGFCTGAVWIGLALLGSIRRKYFPDASSTALFLGALCLILANPLGRLVENALFYQVAISGAVLLQMAMVAAVYRALHSERRAMLWLAAAGALYGLDVGARPSYLPGALPLIIAAAGVARLEPLRFGRRLVRALAAVGTPAALCGAGLMLYNWLRFHSVLEFGMRYQLAGKPQFDFVFFDRSYFLPHLAHFLFGPGFWSADFPFFHSFTGEPYGFLRYTLWGWLAPFALIVRGTRGSANNRYRVFVAVVAAAALGNLLLLASFLGTNERYNCDFACVWLCLSGVGALALSERAAHRRRQSIANGIGCGLAAVSLFTALAVFMAHAPPQVPLLALGRAANWPRYAWRSARHENSGALRVEVKLGPARGDRAEPLVETGRNDQERDWLQLEYLPDHQARMRFCHAGMPGFPSQLFPIPSDGHLVIELLCGSLLPAFDDPTFSGWQPDEFAAVKRDLVIKVNGVQRLRAVMDCYESSPGDLTLGRLKWPSEGVERQFSGNIAGVQRLPLPHPGSIPFKLSEAKPVELTLYLPVQHGSGGEPLLVTGVGAKSDLLYCVYDGRSRIKFGLDHFGNGGAQSEFVPFDGPRPHVVTVWMGSLARPAGSDLTTASASDGLASPWTRRLVVRFDGQILLNVEQSFFSGPPSTARFGVNPFGSTIADRIFKGRIDQVRPVAFASLPTLRPSGSYGGVVLSVRFPSSSLGAHEPLVVTGSSGAGDLLYASYVDDRHVAIGFDHWGSRGLVGAPIEIDYAKPHRLTLTMDSLYPTNSPWAAGGLVQVEIDGAVVLETRTHCYPSRSSEIRIGENPIGGSTCGPRFTGKVLATERTSEPPR